MFRSGGHNRRIHALWYSLRNGRAELCQRATCSLTPDVLQLGYASDYGANGRPFASFDRAAALGRVPPHHSGRHRPGATGLRSFFALWLYSGPDRRGEHTAVGHRRHPQRDRLVYLRLDLRQTSVGRSINKSPTWIK